MRTPLIIENEGNRPIFIKTARTVSRFGLVMMWICVAILAAIFLAKSFLVIVIGFLFLWVAYSALQSGQRRGMLTEEIIVQPEHSGRLAILILGPVSLSAAILHMAFYSTAASYIELLVVVTILATLWRFVGVQK